MILSSGCDTSLSSPTNRAHVYQDNDMGASASSTLMDNDRCQLPENKVITSKNSKTVPAAMTAIDSTNPFQQTRVLAHSGSLDIHKSPGDDEVHCGLRNDSKKRKAEEKDFYAPLNGEREPSRNIVSEVDTTDSSTTPSKFTNASRSSSLCTCSSDDTLTTKVEERGDDTSKKPSGDEKPACGTGSATNLLLPPIVATSEPSSITTSLVPKRRKVTPLPIRAKKEGVVVAAPRVAVGTVKAAPPLLLSKEIPILPKPKVAEHIDKRGEFPHLSPILPKPEVAEHIDKREEFPHLSPGVAKRPAASSKKKSKTKCSARKPRTSRRAPRRPLPMEKKYIDEIGPLPQDVVSGRGGRSNHHPGNQWFWQEILAIRQQYLTADNDWKKNEIAKTVWRNLSTSRKNSFMILADGAKVPVPQLRAASPGGTPPRETALFVQVEKDTKKWFILPEAIALDKIKQALRDKYVPQWAIRMNQQVGDEKEMYNLKLKDTNKSRLPFPAERAAAKAAKKKKKASASASLPHTETRDAGNNLLLLLAATEMGRGAEATPQHTYSSEMAVSPPPPVWLSDGLSHSSSNDEDM